MTDRRGVSITVTHVMTIGITTILIAGLFIGAGNMLDDQRQRSGDRELRSIGDRHVSEMVTATVRGIEQNGTVTVRSRQPERSVGGGYLVNLTDESRCFERSFYDGCLRIDSSGSDVTAEVPVGLPGSTTVDNATVQGGEVLVVYDAAADEVTIEEANP